MSKIKIDFIKYDMDKTKNRKRKDMLVENRSDEAVIAQLERIHKGEKVVTIHEITWGNDPVEKEEPVLHGTVKFYNAEKAFGFIKADEPMDDLFFHKTACIDGTPTDRDRVEFQLSQGPKGLTAVRVRVL